MHAALASRRLGFASTSTRSDEDLQRRIWAYAESPGQFPVDGPTTPFPSRRSIPHGPSVPFPDRRSIPFERQSLLPDPGSPPATHTHDRLDESPEVSSPVYPVTPPDTQSTLAPTPTAPTAPTAHTLVHLLDFASDASVDKLRRGRVLPLHLGPAARHVLLIRAEQSFDLFAECGVLLTLDPGAGDMEIVIAIEAVEDWVEADEALQAELPALFRPDHDEYAGGRVRGSGAVGVYGGIVEAAERVDTPGALQARDKRHVQLVTHQDDDVYLVSSPGPGFVNWLLAGLADALQSNPLLRVSFVNVRSWSPSWVRPHWAGAIVEDLLALSAEQAAEMGPMRIHVHSGIKQAGRSQHAWTREVVRSVREERVGYLDHEGWRGMKREIGAGRL